MQGQWQNRNRRLSCLDVCIKIKDEEQYRGGVVFCFFFKAQLPPLSLRLSAKAVYYVNLQGEATSKTHIMLTKGKKYMKRVLFSPPTCHALE